MKDVDRRRTDADAEVHASADRTVDRGSPQGLGAACSHMRGMRGETIADICQIAYFDENMLGLSEEGEWNTREAHVTLRLSTQSSTHKILFGSNEKSQVLPCSADGVYLA